MANDSKTDEELVAIIREGESELYSLIMRRYKIKLSNYLKRFLNDHDEADDVLQNIFIKVYNNLHGFDIDKKFSSWIYRIAHNEALNFVKKYQKEKTPIEDIEYKLIDENSDVSDDMDKQLLKGKIEKYLDRIKTKYREPIVLFYFEEKSYKEIGDILRIPVSTVGTLITRGKKMLSQIIKKADEKHEK